MMRLLFVPIPVAGVAVVQLTPAALVELGAPVWIAVLMLGISTTFYVLDKLGKLSTSGSGFNGPDRKKLTEVHGLIAARNPDTGFERYLERGLMLNKIAETLAKLEENQARLVRGAEERDRAVGLLVNALGSLQRDMNALLKKREA